ncbi:hypothetical protein B0H14DRAFT_3127898 [Mycena olivaceomarginata]|nr:hypothetical protein B0H14DRAFT_3127898 [Mycena olivaceomarginata]
MAQLPKILYCVEFLTWQKWQIAPSKDSPQSSELSATNKRSRVNYAELTAVNARCFVPPTTSRLTPPAFALVLGASQKVGLEILSALYSPTICHCNHRPHFEAGIGELGCGAQPLGAHPRHATPVAAPALGGLSTAALGIWASTIPRAAPSTRSRMRAQACAVNATMSRSRHRRINAPLSATNTSPRVHPFTVVFASAVLPGCALDLTAGLMATHRRGRGGDDCVRSGYSRQAAMGSTYRRVKCVRTAVLLRPRRNDIALPPVWALILAFPAFNAYYATRIHKLTKAQTKFSLSAYGIYAILLLAVVGIVAGIIQTIWSYGEGVLDADEDEEAVSCIGSRSRSRSLAHCLPGSNTRKQAVVSCKARGSHSDTCSSSAPSCMTFGCLRAVANMTQEYKGETAFKCVDPRSSFTVQIILSTEFMPNSLVKVVGSQTSPYYDTFIKCNWTTGPESGLFCSPANRS